MFSCSNLSITIKDRLLIQDFGLTLFPGSITIITGKNASGKTSLLKAFAGVGSYTGNISWNDVNIKDELNTYHSLINYIAHDNALKSRLTVLENITLWAELKDSTELILPALNYFNLNELIDYRICDLSQGQAKKVALARLMATYADLWLLDEPDVNLDTETKARLDNLITTKASNGGIVIITTHNAPPPHKNYLMVDLHDFTPL